MYAGRIVEEGQARAVFRRPAAPVHVGASGLDPAPRPAQAAAAPDHPRPAAVAASTCRAGCALRAALRLRLRRLPAAGPSSSRAAGPAICDRVLSSTRGRGPRCAWQRASRRAEPRERRERASRCSRGRRSSSTSRSGAACCSARSPQRAGGRRRVVRGARGRDARPRRRVGLRQDDARAAASCACTTLTGGRHVRRAGLSRLSRRELRPAAARAADRLPGSRTRRSTRASASARSSASRSHHGERAGERARQVQELMDDRRALARALQPLPARVLRRPAAADRHRPRARAATRG